MWKPPKIENAPGLGWRERNDGWVAYWIAPVKAVDQGYETKSVRLWPKADEPHPGSPNAAQCDAIRLRCQQLQAELKVWKTAGGKTSPDEIARQFDGTVRSLSRCYQIDPDSPFQNLRFRVRSAYVSNLMTIEATIGDRVLKNLKGRWFKTLYREWSTKADGSLYAARGTALMGMFKILLSYGAGLLEDEECNRIRTFLCGKKDEYGPALKFDATANRKREETLSIEQIIAVRETAHKMGRPEVALAQAVQFELGVRQKDVIGEWVPMNYEGISDVHHSGRKWIVGMTWGEISKDLIMKHRVSKSVRGRQGLGNLKIGETREWDLKLYPMIMEELALIPKDQRTGPLIKNVVTGRPYKNNDFPDKWRKIATAAGVPVNLQNRDTRATTITETIEAAGAESGRLTAGHKKMDTTGIYNRERDRRTAEAALLRAEHRSNKRSNVRSNAS